MFEGNQLPTIDAPRLRLRWLTTADVTALYTIFSHPEVMQYWSWRAFTEPTQAQDLLESIHQCFEKRTLYQWGIADRATDQIVGTATLWQIHEANRRAEIGFALARDRWGQGLMQEALRALLGYCFGVLELHRVEADVDPGNVNSLRLLERLGFQREGYMRERWLEEGGPKDTVFFGLLAREFDPRGRP